MYSRNLGKGVVRASPSYTALPKYNELLPAQRPIDENRYRYNIPPGYDGSRFSRREPPEDEMDMKRHAAPSVERPEQDPPRQTEEAITEPEYSDITDDAEIISDPPETEENREVQSDDRPVQPSKEYRTAGSISGTLETVSSFISMLKDRISGDDLLLIVIILMLALDGEDAEITILLLTLLLLVK